MSSSPNITIDSGVLFAIDRSVYNKVRTDCYTGNYIDFCMPIFNGNLIYAPAHYYQSIHCDLVLLELDFLFQLEFN